MLKVVSSLTHPSNVNCKRGLERVQHVYVCTVRKGKYIRKKKLEKKYLIPSEKIAEFGILLAEIACWDREGK